MNAKQIAGQQAASYVEDGMRIGLGTGSTAYWAIHAIADRVKQGLKIEAIPTSKGTEKLALELGIPLTDFSRVQNLDLTIDGADEVDAKLQLIKGGGGALFREKLVAAASDQLIIVVDETKEVDVLGAFHLPVEIAVFAWETTVRRISGIGCTPRLRQKAGQAYVTDNGNYILDCPFGSIMDPAGLSHQLDAIIGVVEHGLFVNMADRVVIGTSGGEARVREKGF
ncbi:ribose-5-phosphate isomerase RpiA [Paenibacillus sp. GP183]|uniref:ribose-5-phosphate isomerase RpiA n=1 Tax=Paenibacillus sp. GP183 TaxID=1882751 RepID=UPI000899EA2D|nr:ribose-5-phosphate isomerase RpiA [Paenibacillus sp. GP183]SEB55378.1 ribose-5-phosphate isomerase [Paenibacillus sp. GP183]